MELDSLKAMWQQHELEKSTHLNLHTLGLIQAQKVKSVLAPLFWQRVIEITLHSIAIILLAIFCFYNYEQWPYEISAYMLIFFYSLNLKNCLFQLRSLNSIDTNKDVISIQSSLAKIQSNNLNFLRLSVLFIPALLSFPVVISKAIIDLKLNSVLNFDIIQQTNGNWWIAQVIAFAILIPLGIWFYKEVNYKNVHKKWVNNLIEKASGIRVKKAVEYIKELEILKYGNI